MRWWEKFGRPFASRLHSRRGGRRARRWEVDQPLAAAETLEERRLLAVTAVADVYSVQSTGVLTTTDPTGDDFDSTNDGVLANDSGAAAVAGSSTGTFHSAAGATVTMNTDGTFVYDPSSSVSLQALGPGAVAVDTFNYTATDGMGGSATGQVSVYVEGNHAPEVVSSYPQRLNVIPRDETDSAGSPVSYLQWGLSDQDYSPPYYPPIGIAVVGADAGDGRWQYSLDYGATWNDLGAVASDSALLLGPDDRLRFVPGAVENEPTIQFRAWDLTSGAAGDRADTTVNGGATAFSTSTGTAYVNVWSIDVPTDPIIDPHTGETELTFLLSSPVQGPFDVSIDWGDGTVQSLGSLSAGTYTVSHTYARIPLANASQASVPILIEAVEFFSDDYLGGMMRVLAMAFPAVTITIPSPSPLQDAPQAVVLPPVQAPMPILLPAPTPVIGSDVIDIRSSGSYTAANPHTQYVLRLVQPVNNQGGVRESDDIPLPDDVLEDLPGLYKKLGNDRYRVYQLRRDGSYRLVQDVIVRDGVATPVEDEPSERQPVEGDPGGDTAPRGASTLDERDQRGAFNGASYFLPLDEDGDEVLQMPPSAATREVVDPAARVPWWVSALALSGTVVGAGWGAAVDDRRGWSQRVDEALSSTSHLRALRPRLWWRRALKR